MESHSSLFVKLMVGFQLLVGLAQGYTFYVGGRDGWVPNPSENYNHWAERNRFQVNDTLFFKYKKGSDSVLIVKKDDYYSCNTKNPINSLTDGNSTFVFDHSGPYFFISGNNDSCNKGQKLIIIVMAVRPKPLPPTPKSPSPIAPPPMSPSQPTTSPPAKSPTGETPSDSNGPAVTPTNHKSGSEGFGAGSLSTGLVLGASVGVSLILGSFVGMV